MTNLPRRKKAIAEWERVKAYAIALNQEIRIPKRPLTGLSAAEIENMAWTLSRVLAKIALKRLLDGMNSTSETSTKELSQ